MTDPRDLDPYPFEDMPCDIRFRLFLDGLMIENVAHELDPPRGTTEAQWVKRRREATARSSDQDLL